MKNLKQTFKISVIVIVTSAMNACGGGGKDIDAVKLMPVKMGKEFQYVDAEGKIIINPQFKEATIFRNGLALVQTSGDKPQWGFIGEDGKFAIIANYKSATVFSDDMAWVVSENAAPSCINTKGELKFTLTNAEEVKIFSEGLAGFKEINETGEEKWGFVDKEGKVKINAQFNNAGSFLDGKCPVSNIDGKWGYIDKEGKLVISHQFDNAESFFNGSAVVKAGSKAGLIDATGKYLINPQYSDMQSDGDLFLVEQDGKFGWTDKEGKIIINPQFSAAFPFNNGNLASVQSGEKYGFIDKEGKIIINPQFDGALPFNGKLALVVSANKIGFIDNEGKYVINPQFDDVSKDMVEYFQTGGSKFSSVKTDFFNVGAITSRIKTDAPEGLTFNSTMTEVLTKFKKSQEDFSKYSEEHMMISSEKITNDATLNFYILVSPWVSEYYDYAFDAGTKPTGFAYMINLTGKGNGKEDAVKTAIETSLTGYTKDATMSNETEAVYKNTKQSVKVSTKNGNIVIAISFLAAASNVAPSSAINNSSSTQGKFPQASDRLLTSSDLSGISKKDLKIMKNEIFARKGYIFKTAEMKSYFATQSWYSGQYDDVTSMLSAEEKQNVELIKKYE